MLWFTKVAFKWRTAACTVWLQLLVFPPLLLFQLLTTCTPLHPVTWISEWICNILSLRNLLFVSLYLALLATLSILFSLTYTVQLPIYKTRLSILLSVVQPSHAIAVGVFTILGMGGGRCLAELGGYWRMWEPCEGYERCLNEHQLFCTLSGAFLGLCYGAEYFVNKEHFLVFPSLQQQKLFRLRGHLSSHLCEGLAWTLKKLKYYYPLYFLAGAYPREKLVHTFDFHLRDGVQLDTIGGLLDVGLFVHVLLTGTMLHVSWSFGLRMFRVFQTEAIRFPVVATFSGEASWLLTTAMKAKTIPLLMYLGYLDLHQLSIHSAQRRKQVYSLNEAGHPAVWNDISSECISLISSLTTKLGGKTPQEDEKAGLTLTPPSTYNFMSPTQKGWPSPPVASLSPPGATRRNIYNERARLWSSSPGVERVHSSSGPVQQKTPGTADKLKQLVTKLKDLPKKIAENLKKKPLFVYFLSELPEVSTQEWFADSRLQVWAITGISELAAASYTEDSYGVVQRTLPNILTALINLAQVLDKHVKAPLSSSRSTRNVQVALEVNGRYAVKMATQTALHRLSTTFAKERRSIHLSEDHQLYWSTFLGEEEHNLGL